MIADADIRTKSLALIVVDIQNKYAQGAMAEPVAGILPVVNDAIGMFRDSGRPVFFIRMTTRSACVPEDMEDPDGFVEGLDFREGDPVVPKSEMNAFHGTGLGGMLRTLGCDGAVICGLVSRWCVHATYFGAYDEDVCPYILRGGIAGADPENTRMVEALCKTVGPEEILGSRGFRD